MNYDFFHEFSLPSGADSRLLVISKRTLLGSLPGGHEVYRIDRVAVLTLSSNESPECELDVSWYTSLHVALLAFFVLSINRALDFYLKRND